MSKDGQPLDSKTEILSDARNLDLAESQAHAEVIYLALARDYLGLVNPCILGEPTTSPGFRFPEILPVLAS